MREESYGEIKRMHRNLWTGIRAALLATLALGTTALAATPTADSVATDQLKDMTGTLRVVKADFAELGKISREFRVTYRFKRMDVAYKFPNRTRLETKAAGMTGILIFNENTRYYKLPIRTDRKDITGQPGQKQGLLQLGVFSKDFLDADYEAVYQKTDNGRLVFKLNQRGTDNKSHEVVWVNPKNHIIEKRQSFNGDNKLRMETRYLSPQQVRPGIFVPTRIEIYNQNGKLGAVQAFEGVKVNLGVSDALFETK